MAQDDMEKQSGVKGEEEPRASRAESTQSAAGSGAAEPGADSPPVAAPGKKRRSFFGGLLRFVGALLALLVVAGGAAIAFKDQDERLRVVADFIEGAAKDPGAAASAASAQIERSIKQLLGQEEEKPAPHVAGRKTPVPPTPPVPLTPRAAAPAQPAPAPPAETAAPVAPVVSAQAPASAPAPQAESKPPAVSREDVAALKQEIAALKQETAAATEAAREALETARAALDAAKEAQRAEPARTSEIGEKPASAAALAEQRENVTALEGRIDELGDEIKKLRERVDQPKETARADAEATEPSKPATADTAGVEALALSELLSEEFRHGRPFAAVAAALAERGADRSLLADLAPFAERGAPTTAKLLAEFAPIARRLLAQQGPPASNETFWEGLTRIFNKIVRVKGSAPEAASLDARIVEVEVALAHDEASDAAQAFARLPQDPDGAAFGEKLTQLAKARASSSALIAGAVARLGHLKN